MKGRIAAILILAAGGVVLAAPPVVPPKSGGQAVDAKALRQVRKIDKDRFEVLYKFEDEYAMPAAQAAKRSGEAAKAWAKFDKASNPVAVIARSPFGGGESSKSYWPEGVEAGLLKNVVGPLEKAGLKVVLPDMVEEEGKDQAGGAVAKKPFPDVGFSEDYEFVLVIGLHHEPVPHGGVSRTVAGKVVYSRSSRVNAWAILFHCPTATAFWGATAVARVDRGAAADPLSQSPADSAAAETAIGALDFTDIGADNIPGYIEKLAEPDGLECLDTAAMLAQTQRADAADAIVNAATSEAGFKNTVRVVRYFNQKGVVQDYRTDRATAERRKDVEVSQPVMMRVLLLEHLRGLRGIQPCAVLACVPRMTDVEIPGIAQQQAGHLMPLSADDEIVLIGELANSDPLGIFARNRVAAVRNLGRCRVHIDEAKAAARTYAERKAPAPRRGGAPVRDDLKEAGAAALEELNKSVKEKGQ